MTDVGVGIVFIFLCFKSYFVNNIDMSFSRKLRELVTVEN